MRNVKKKGSLYRRKKMRKLYLLIKMLLKKDRASEVYELAVRLKLIKGGLYEANENR